jgi:hypothetical protein
MTLLGLLEPEDEGTKLLKNSGDSTHNETASHPKDIQMDTAASSETWACIYDNTWHHVSLPSEPQI